MNFREREFARAPRAVLGLLLLIGILAFAFLFGERVVNGNVLDAYTKRAVRGASVTLRTSGAAVPQPQISETDEQSPTLLRRLTEPPLSRTAITDREGSFKLLGARPVVDLPAPVMDIVDSLGLPVNTEPSFLMAQAASYANAEIMFDGVGSMAQVQMRPNTLFGVVYEEATNIPVPNAFIGLGDKITRTDANGIFTLKSMPSQANLTIQSAGYQSRQVGFDRRTAIAISLKPFIARGAYLPYGIMQSGPSSRAFIDNLAASGLNAIVIDAKSERGFLTYPSEIPLAKQAKADIDQDIFTLDKVVQRAHERNIYVIARICTFKDITMAQARPDLALRDGRTGKVWTPDAETAWLDPYKAESGDYALAIAKEVAQRGVDEIQFDYIRFPGGDVPPGVPFARENTDVNRRAALTGFLAKVRQELLPYNVAISADVFGFTALYSNELGIGQRIDEFGKHMDFVSPMLYPSTFGDDDPKFDTPPQIPSAHPYTLIKLCMEAAIKRLERNPVKLRPWLQSYPDGKYGLPFGATQVLAQIQAAEEAGSHGWLLWNPYGEYFWDQIPKSGQGG